MDRELTLYAPFIKEIKELIHRHQYDAMKAVNHELMQLYWEIGRGIDKKQREEGWGRSVVRVLAKELQKEFPGVRGFSARNLWVMRNFYNEYSENVILPSSMAEIQDSKLATSMREIQNPIVQTSSALIPNPIVQTSPAEIQDSKLAPSVREIEPGVLLMSALEMSQSRTQRSRPPTGSREYSSKAAAEGTDAQNARSSE